MCTSGRQSFGPRIDYARSSMLIGLITLAGCRALQSMAWPVCLMDTPLKDLNWGTRAAPICLSSALRCEHDFRTNHTLAIPSEVNALLEAHMQMHLEAHMQMHLGAHTPGPTRLPLHTNVP